MTTPAPQAPPSDAKVADLAARIATAIIPHLRARPAVTVDRMHRTNKATGPAAYIDLAFEGVGTVYGFKLMNKAGGARWLAVPQTKKPGTGGAGEPDAKWEDKFKWASKAAQEEAERVAKAEFDKGAKPAADDAGFDGGAFDDGGQGMGGGDDIPF